MSRVLRAVIPGRPSPKARPRPGRNGGYYVPSNKAQEAMAWQLTRYKGLYPAGPVRVECEFHLADRAGRRGDGDNYVKVVWDALQDAGVLHDDLQVVEWEGKFVKVAAKDECTVIRVGRPIDFTR